MKAVLAAALASVSAVSFANNSTVTVDEIEGGGYAASYYSNTAQTSPEIHLIGVYEPNSNASTGTAVVNVVGSSDVPVNLVLSAYAPTQWVLQGTGVQYINSVLINGYYPGSVSGIDSGLVIDKSGADKWLGSYAYAWPATSGGSDTQALVAQVEQTFGAPISTFAGAYGATSFTVSLAAVPEPSRWALMALGLMASAGVSRLKRQPGRQA